MIVINVEVIVYLISRHKFSICHNIFDKIFKLIKIYYFELFEMKFYIVGKT